MQAHDGSRLVHLNAGKAGSRAMLFCFLAAALVLCGCQQKSEEKAPEIRPVRTVTVSKEQGGQLVSLTGRVEAEDEASLAFRVSGRMIERTANVGDRVEAGQVIARLEPQNAQNTLRSAQAAVNAADGQLIKTTAAFDRQNRLLGQGFTTRANHDAARQAMRLAQAQVDDAKAQLRIAQDNLAYTELEADAPGIVTARGAEPGEVVQVGQMIVRLARQDGRDAVFDAPAQLLSKSPPNAVVKVSLADNRSVTADGRVREVAAQADPVTRTFQVHVGLTNPPEAMRLGSTVIGEIRLENEEAMEIPASALTAFNGQPAVWVVDPAAMTVSMRNIEVSSFNPATVVVASGIDAGDVVVTAGVQALHPGQQVRLLGSGA